MLVNYQHHCCYGLQMIEWALRSILPGIDTVDTPEKKTVVPCFNALLGDVEIIFVHSPKLNLNCILLLLFINRITPGLTCSSTTP